MNKNQHRWDPETYNADIRSVLDLMKSAWFTTVQERSKVKIGRGTKVLEVGVGGGKWAATFAFFGCFVTVVDNLATMLEKVKENFPTFKMEFVLDDARTLEKIPDETYDLVFSDGLVEHFLDADVRRKVIKNLYAKVKKGGTLCYIIPARSKELDEHCYEDFNDAIEELSCVNEATMCLAQLYRSDKPEVWWEIFVYKKNGKDLLGT